MDLRDYLRPGDSIVVGQATAEPPRLVEQLLDAAHSVSDLSVFCGYAQSSEWERASDGSVAISSFAAHGPLRALSTAGALDVLPVHMSRIEPAIRSGRIPCDVVILQVGPADLDGYHDLGATVDYVWAAAERARVVIVEVNGRMPRTTSSSRLHRSRITASIRSDEPLVESPSREPSDTERRVAAVAADLVPSGATIQLGIGSLADAVADQLRTRSDLRVRSGLVGEWLVDLFEAGALSAEPGSCVTGMALGGERLYSFLEETDIVQMAPIATQLDPVELASCESFAAINSAIEVDLMGQVGSEAVGTRYIGAVGGQMDYFRAARMSRNGLAIVALPSMNSQNRSRIVSELSGPVTTPKSDVDVVATEWGTAHISSSSLAERATRLSAVAAPDMREALFAARSQWQ